MRVADAVCYEGYLLYPYRKSSAKNRVRWQFGVVAPRRWVERAGPVRPTVAGSAESWYQRTESLVQAPPDTELRVVVRFLQWQGKTVEQAGADGRFSAVDELTVDDDRHLSFDEAVASEHQVTVTLGQLLARERVVPMEVPGGTDTEALIDAGGVVTGRVVRHRRPLSASVHLSAEPVGDAGLHRLAIRVENADRSTPADAARAEVLQRSLLATHVLVACDGGRFLSLLDPPAEAAAAAKACTNHHAFPVLAGPDGCDHVLLASPILLYDHPRVAPESPGDLFDAGEIDEILSLRVLTLSDAEKVEARATDPRAAAIVDRVEGMPRQVLAGLHGTRRDGRGRPGDEARPHPPDDVERMET